jgi:hypothetical protein
MLELERERIGSRNGSDSVRDGGPAVGGYIGGVRVASEAWPSWFDFTCAVRLAVAGEVVILGLEGCGSASSFRRDREHFDCRDGNRYKDVMHTMYTWINLGRGKVRERTCTHLGIKVLRESSVGAGRSSKQCS